MYIMLFHALRKKKTKNKPTPPTTHTQVLAVGLFCSFLVCVKETHSEQIHNFEPKESGMCGSGRSIVGTCQTLQDPSGRRLCSRVMVTMEGQG